MRPLEYSEGIVVILRYNSRIWYCSNFLFAIKYIVVLNSATFHRRPWSKKYLCNCMVLVLKVTYSNHEWNVLYQFILINHCLSLGFSLENFKIPCLVNPSVENEWNRNKEICSKYFWYLIYLTLASLPQQYFYSEFKYQRWMIYRIQPPNKIKDFCYRLVFVWFISMEKLENFKNIHSFWYLFQ